MKKISATKGVRNPLYLLSPIKSFYSEKNWFLFENTGFIGEKTGLFI